MRLKQAEGKSTAVRTADSTDEVFGAERIAALLDEWRPAVLRQMRRSRLWWDAPVDEHEDQYQDASLALYGRQFDSEEHLRRALWTALGFRARDFWKSAHRREVSVGQLFDDVQHAKGEDGVADTAATLADRRQIHDCLSELDVRERSVYRLVRGEGLSRLRVAKALGLRDADVLRALYSAQRKIDRVVLVMMSGRLCARRSPAIVALARAEADSAQREQARAHLAHCQECLLTFRHLREELSDRVASLLPLPVLAADPGAVERVAAVVRDTVGAAKRVASSIADRVPGVGNGSEAVVGGGGGAIGAKLAVGLCVTAAAGGGAVCVGQLGLFQSGHRDRHPAREAKQRQTPRRLAKRSHPAPPPPVARLARLPAHVARTTRRQAKRPARTGTPRSVQKSAAASQPPAAPPQQEFFDASGGSGSAGGGGSGSSGAHAASKPPPASSGSGARSGGGSSGGGEEFFGG